MRGRGWTRCLGASRGRILRAGGVLTDGRTIAYAAGLNVVHYRGFNEVSHSGTTAAYNAWPGRYPDQGLSVAVLCNTSAANGTQLGHAGDRRVPARRCKSARGIVREGGRRARQGRVWDLRFARR